MTAHKPQKGKRLSNDANHPWAAISRYELPLWFAFCVWAFLPTELVPWFHIADIPVNFGHIVVIPVALIYLYWWWPPRSTSNKWHYNLPAYTLLLLCYAGISMLWAGLGSRDATAMSYTMIINFFTLLLGYTVIARQGREAVERFLWRLSIFIGTVGFLYFAEFYFSLGFSSPDVHEVWGGGMYRIHGPFFPASLGSFIMMPALGFTTQKFMNTSQHRWLYSLLAIVLAIAILATGARGALVMLGIFGLLAGLFLPSARQRIFALTLLLIMALIASVVVFSKVDPGRMVSAEASGRVMTHWTSWNLVKNAPNLQKIFGWGLGRWWAWYLPDVEYGGTRVTGRFFIHTPYGVILHQPHSVLLFLGVELGLVGLIYFAFLWSVLFRAAVRSIQTNRYPIFAISLIAACTGLFIDYMVFRAGQETQIVFWLYLFGLLSLVNRNSEKSAGQDGKA